METMTEKVLLVDDDPAILEALSRHLRKRFDIQTALGGEEALVLVEAEDPFAVVMCDMTMPVINGIEVLDRFRERSPDTVRMMLTGNADQRTAVEAVNRGNIFRFFNKPCSAEEIAGGLDQGIQQYRLIRAERELLEKTLAGSVKVLTDILSMADHASFGRAAAVRDWAREIAPHLQFQDPWRLEIAAMLAPIGRIAIPAEILKKADTGMELSPREKAMVERVPEIGRDLVANIPRMAEVAEIVYYQHRGFDGSGFPEGGAVGTDIPAESRLLRILGDLACLFDGETPDSALIGHLKKAPDPYCPVTLRAVEEWVAREQAKGKKGGNETMVLSVDLLEPGHVLLEDLKTPNGHLVLSAGARLSEIQVQRLRNFQEAWEFKSPVRVTR
jgi:response regulator RpfG family c-di-GMP phosphodiesterase